MGGAEGEFAQGLGVGLREGEEGGGCWGVEGPEEGVERAGEVWEGEVVVDYDDYLVLKKGWIST